MSTFHVYSDKENRIPAKHFDNAPVKCSKIDDGNQVQRKPFGALKEKRNKLTVRFAVENPEIQVYEQNGKVKELFEETEEFELVTNERACTKPIESKTENDDLLLPVAEYAQDIWKYMHHLEIKFTLPKQNYMNKQTHLNDSMRSILIDWLAAVVYEYKLNEQTLHLCVNYIDTFLSSMSVVKEKFQLLGVTAMMVAVKVEEVNLINVEEWTYLTGQAYNQNQIIRMERLLLKVLNFDLNLPTMLRFIKQLCFSYKFDEKILSMAMYLSELVLLEGGEFLKFLPSQLAAASVVLARCILNKKDPWFKNLEFSTGYSYKQLKPVMLKQFESFKDSPTKNEQTIQNKYKTQDFHGVASITPTILQFPEYDD